VHHGRVRVVKTEGEGANLQLFQFVRKTCSEKGLDSNWDTINPELHYAKNYF
jgi:hypothetical protein